jgi:hypothetical protein
LLDLAFALVFIQVQLRIEAGYGFVSLDAKRGERTNGD